jgi:hypothetical protein
MRILDSISRFFAINQAYMGQKHRVCEIFAKTFQIRQDIHNFATMALSPNAHILVRVFSKGA